MIRFIFISFFILVNASITLNAQLSGVVKDGRSGKSIEGAEIFINNSSWRGVSGEDGSFLMDGIHSGIFELVVYKKGYEIFQSNLRIQNGKAYRLNLELTQNHKSKSVKVIEDDAWKGNLLRFKKELIGVDDASDEYKLGNTQSLQFTMSGNSLIAKSADPLRIENLKLGIILQVYLLHFKSDQNGSDIKTLVSFHWMKSGDHLQQSSFEISRLKAYWGSLRHFLQSLVAHETDLDGFVIRNSMNKVISPSGLVTNGLVEGYYNIDFTNALTVSFRENHVSIVNDSKLFEANEYGLPLSMSSISITGAMKESGLANKLPINYFPSFAIPNQEVFWKNYPWLQEKIYLQTDRDYYYPGETLWHKAYLSYLDPAFTDSLSTTLYVDLFSPELKPVDSKKYAIKEGVAWGDILLNDTLPSGQYYLRAYTNWMRNFGDSSLFVKTVPILAVNENIVWNEKEDAQVSEEIKVEADKEQYKARQEVKLKLTVTDENGNPLKANLSIAVTDGVESVPLSQNSITSFNSFGFPSVDDRSHYFSQIIHPMEQGVTIRGVVKNGKGNPIPANVEIVNAEDELLTLSTNDQGVFMASGFDYEDSIVLAIMAYAKKNRRQVDSVHLLPREIPTLNVKSPTFALEFRKFDALQRIQNTYQLDDAILLQEVVVKSTSLAKKEPNLQTLDYGTPDHTVKGDDIRFVGRNLLVGLKGRVPGLQVIEAQDGISIRLRGPKSLAGYS